MVSPFMPRALAYRCMVVPTKTTDEPSVLGKVRNSVIVVTAGLSTMLPLASALVALPLPRPQPPLLLLWTSHLCGSGQLTSHATPYQARTHLPLVSARRLVVSKRLSNLNPCVTASSTLHADWERPTWRRRLV